MSAPGPGLGFQRRGFVELARLSWRDLARPGMDATTGVRGNPLRQVATGLLLLGAFFAAGNLVHADEATWVRRLALSVGFLSALLMVPDTVAGRDAKRDVLVPLPISPRTVAASRLFTVLMVTTVAAGCFALPSLLLLRFHAGTPWSRTLALGGSLVIEAFTIAGLVHAAALVIGARLGLARVRQTMQLLLIGLLLLVGLGTWLETPAFRAWAGLDASADWLPPTWFLALGAPGAQPWPALGALALLGVAVVVGTRLDVDVLYERMMAAAHAPAERPGPAERLTTGLAGLPWIGRLVLPAPVHGLTTLLLRARRRYEVTRLQEFLPRLLVVAAAAASLFTDRLLSQALLASFAMSGVLGGLRSARQCPDAEAAWIVLASPLSAGQRVRAVLWSVAIADTLLPSLLLALVSCHDRPLLDGLAVALALPAIAAAASTFHLAWKPFAPLATEARLGQGLGDFLASYVGAIATVIPIMVADVLVTLMPGQAALVLLGGWLILFVVSAALARRAGRRLEALGRA